MPPAAQIRVKFQQETNWNVFGVVCLGTLKVY
jgi:hypothetical protein